jgi:phage-related protein
MEAQKIILAEVNKEFGGSAEAAGKTLPGQINVLKESFSNLAGELISTLVPALTTITTFFVKNPALAKAMVIGILAISAAMVALNVALAITAALASPWILIAVGIAAGAAAIAAGLIYAYKTSDTFRAIVDGAFSAVQAIASALFNWFKSNWPLLLGIITGPVGVAAVLVIKYWSQIQSATHGAWNAIRSLTTAAWNAVQSFVSSVAGAISSTVSSAWSSVRNATSTAWGGVRSVVSDVVGDVKSAISGLGTWISGWASGTFAAITSRVGSFFDRIADGARDAVASVQRNMNAVVNAVESIIGRVENAAQGIASAIKRPINAVLSAWNSISLTIPKITIPSVKIGKKKIGGGSFGGQTFGFPNVPLLAQGGVVTSPTLALIGEAGPEAVVPLDRLPAPDVQVRVFIGDQELTALVRTEIVSANTGLARALLAG